MSQAIRPAAVKAVNHPRRPIVIAQTVGTMSAKQNRKSTKGIMPTRMHTMVSVSLRPRPTSLAKAKGASNVTMPINVPIPPTPHFQSLRMDDFSRRSPLIIAGLSNLSARPEVNGARMPKIMAPEKQPMRAAKQVVWSVPSFAAQPNPTSVPTKLPTKMPRQVNPIDFFVMFFANVISSSIQICREEDLAVH